MIPRDPQELFDLEQVRLGADDLKSLASDTENEFLTIGERLNKVASLCRGMTDNAVQLSSQAHFTAEKGGGVEKSFVEKNAEIFTETAGRVKKFLATLPDGEGLVNNLVDEVGNLGQPLQKLNGIGKTFRVLGISIKVESSRNRNATHGFRLLADEVVEIALSVQNNCRYCLEKTNEVEKGIATSGKVLSASSNSYDDSAEQAVSNIMNSLKDVSHKAETLAEGIQERSGAMVQGIDDVVMAMQFHDIVRQRLEAVSHALVEAVAKTRSVNEADSEKQRERIVLDVYTALSLQVAHLDAIHEQVVSAGKQIERGLNHTMEQAKIQAEDAKALLEMDAGSRKTSVVASLEKEIDTIVSSLNRSLEVVTEAVEVSRTIYNVVEKIGSFVKKIENIAFDVKVLAINAMIEAIKASTEGNTMIALAKELRNLSQETREGVAAAVDSLHIITKGTKKQLEYTASLDQNRALVDEMIEQAGEFTSAILASLQDVGRCAGKIDKSSRDLTSRITKLVTGITFPRVMTRRITASRELIECCLKRLDEQCPQLVKNNSEVRQKLETLVRQYDMDRERFRETETAKKAREAASGAIELFIDDNEQFGENQGPRRGEDTEEETFGTNVELF